MNTNFAKIFSWKISIALFLGVGLFIAGLSVFLQTRNQVAEGFSFENSNPPAWYSASAIGIETIPKTIDTGSSFEAPGQPTLLSIPAIGVKAKIQSVGLSTKGDGNMGIPTNFTDVAWYNQGTLPGMPGSAVIAGHLDGKKVPKAVFYNLSNLKNGDLIEITDQYGKIMQFKVTKSKIYDYDAPTEEIFTSKNSKAQLNLITCGGSWIKSKKLYNKRIVVFTELINN